MKLFTLISTSLLGSHRERDPPDPISNSEVKPFIADDSVGFPHVKVGHRQAFKVETPDAKALGVFFCLILSGTMYQRALEVRCFVVWREPYV